MRSGKKSLTKKSTDLTMLKSQSHWLRPKYIAAPRSLHAFFYLRVTAGNADTELGAGSEQVDMVSEIINESFLKSPLHSWEVSKRTNL